MPKADDRAGLSTDEDTDGEDAPKLGPRLTEKVKKPKKRKVGEIMRSSDAPSRADSLC